MPAPIHIERILVRGTNWLGDAVMTTPALQRLRASFPHAHISLLAAPLTADLLSASPWLDEVIAYRRGSAGRRAFFSTVKLLRARRFDLAVLFQNAFEAALLARLAGARLRLGFAEQGRGWLLTHQLHRQRSQPPRHQLHDYLALVAACERVCLGADFQPATATPMPSLTANLTQLRAAEELLLSFGIKRAARPLIALNTGATNSRAKCWPVDRFAWLADRLKNELHAQVVLIGGAAESAYAARVLELMRTGGALNLAGKTDMAALVGLLARCDLLVSNDTGPAHVAAALGRPTLTIFGPTNEYETAPTGAHATIIRARGIECARCMYRDCPIDHRCMTRLTADDVYARARALLLSASAA